MGQSSMKKKISTLSALTICAIFNTIFVQDLFAASEEDIARVLSAKMHSALQCASQFGQVADLQITDIGKQDGLLYVRGQYFMKGLWGRAPGTFKATVDSDFKLTWMQWKEPNNAANVSEYCLN